MRSTSSRRELEEIRQRMGAEAPADYRLILDAHLMMHSDELLVDIAMEAIAQEHVNAEWAVERARWQDRAPPRAGTGGLLPRPGG